jgi:hypothetical protein
MLATSVLRNIHLEPQCYPLSPHRGFRILSVASGHHKLRDLSYLVGSFIVQPLAPLSADSIFVAVLWSFGRVYFSVKKITAPTLLDL